MGRFIEVELDYPNSENTTKNWSINNAAWLPLQIEAFDIVFPEII